jgi:hypothetical protein
MASRKLFLGSFGSLLVSFSIAQCARSMQITSPLPADWKERLERLKQNPTGREWLAAHPHEKYLAFSKRDSDDIPESWCAVASSAQETAKGKSVIKNYFFIPEDGSLPGPGAPSEVIRQCRLGLIVIEFHGGDSLVAEEWVKTADAALDKLFPAAGPEKFEGNPNFPYPWYGFADWEEKRFSVWVLRNDNDKTRAALVAWNHKYWELTYEPTHTYVTDLVQPAAEPLERVDDLLNNLGRKNDLFETISSQIDEAAIATVNGGGPQDPTPVLKGLAGFLRESKDEAPADRAAALFMTDQAIEALMWAYELNSDDPGNEADYRDIQALGAKISGVGSRGNVVYSHNLAVEATRVAPFSPAGQHASLNLMRHRFYPPGCQVIREVATQTVQEGLKLLSGNISQDTRSEAELLIGDAYAELAVLDDTAATGATARTVPTRFQGEALDHYQRVLANHARADFAGNAVLQIWRLRANLPGEPGFECSKTN